MRGEGRSAEGKHAEGRSSWRLSACPSLNRNDAVAERPLFGGALGLHEKAPQTHRRTGSPKSELDLDPTRFLHHDGHQEGVAVGDTRLGTKPCLHPLLAVLAEAKIVYCPAAMR